MTIYEHAIVGFGIAGQLLVCELIQRGIQPCSIVILDPNWMGGALATDYSQVLSNTPWWKTRQALSAYPAWSSKAIEEGDRLFQTDQCMPVGSIAKLCCQVGVTAASGCERITTVCLDMDYESDGWTLRHTFGTLRTKRVYLTHGGQEKHIEFPLAIPQISLVTALDKHLLSRVVASNDSVLVIGCSHSGTIILDHLHQLGIPTIGVYNTPTPFQFARDGHYDGIKEGSEQIADAILRGDHAPTTQLISYSDSFKMYKALQKVTKCIQCIGFEAKPIGCQQLKSNPTTAQIEGPPKRYGYGIAFPGMTELNGKLYPDVSVLSFQEQIRRTLPQILLQE
jgi:hypothetical protein